MPSLIERRAFTPQSDERLRFLTLIASLGFLGLLVRLFGLQIFHGAEMFRLAELNRTQVIPLRAPRGYVMDRHGDVLLDNAPRFSLFYSRPAGAQESERGIEQKLGQWFPGSETLIRRKVVEARQTGKMTRVFSGIRRDTALALIERRLTLPGVTVVAEPQRRARYGALASHILGYVDEVSPAELDRLKNEGYRQGQLVGKSGVERAYNTYLKGEDGGLQFEMDAGGRHVQVMRQIPSQSGRDVHLTIDRRLQEAVERGLANSPSRRGAVVAVDPRNGAVLALASFPDVDPTGDLMPALKDPELPLFNRALQGTYPPGSIFKVMTGLAALEEGRWDIRKTFFCPGVFRLGSKEFGCWKVHRLQDFMGAVAWSCNFYFYNLGLHLGPDPIERMAKAFGFGEKTGIDLPAESSGLIPGREWKRRAQRAGWFDGDTANFSIGQGAVVVSPLQAAMMIAAVANGGDLWRPYLVESIQDPGGRRVFQQTPQLRRKVQISPESMKIMRQAMEGVVTTGSGRSIYRTDLVAGAKTGTAQNPHGQDHAWFAAYAGPPQEPPSLAMVVFVEHGGMGSVAAGPIAREAINAYFQKSAEHPAVGTEGNP